MVERATTKSTPGTKVSRKWLRSQFLDSCRQRNPALALKSSNPVASCFRNQWRDLSLRNIRGEPLCTLVNEIIGLPLALSLFPQVYDFQGEAVLHLVERGLYRKGFRVRRDADNRPKSQR
jgi:hypothetical protein